MEHLVTVSSCRHYLGMPVRGDYQERNEPGGGWVGEGVGVSNSGPVWDPVKASPRR